jgi:tryptophanyl-tRNA synthetase
MTSITHERSHRLEVSLRRRPEAHRILTGDRPTGPLHLGHLFGTLENRVRLQRLGVELLVVIADYQAITDRDSPDTLPRDVEALVADYLAVGVDPCRAIVFAHSQVPALNQLMLPFLSLVSVSELQRNPTVKAEAAEAGALSGLMLTYPVHQAADILFCRATAVPVGRDQLPHLELARSIARRFNRRYGAFFPEPEALLSDAPLLLGTDGRKMSKSRNNAIALSATADETARAIASAKTDAERRITYEPARRPEVSNLVLLAALCQGRPPAELAEEIGGAGSAALKRVVAEAVNERLRPIRARRAELVSDRAHLQAVLRDGNERAEALAAATLREVRRLMHTSYEAAA